MTFENDQKRENLSTNPQNMIVIQFQLDIQGHPKRMPGFQNVIMQYILK